MRTLDGLLRDYFTWKRGLGAPGIRLVEDHGYMPRPKCAACGSKVRHATATGPYVCGHCGEAWPADHMYQLTGQIQRTPRNTAEAHMGGRWIDIGAVLGTFIVERPWPARVLLERVVIRRSRSDLLAHAAADPAWVAEGPWSTHRVREMERAARTDLVARLSAKGIQVAE